MRFLAFALPALILLLPSAAHADDAMTSASEAVPNPPQRRRRDPVLFAAGLTTAITGGAAANVGAVLTWVGGDPCMMGPCEGHVRNADESMQNAGIILMVGGALMIAAGIPMAVAGGRKDPPKSEAGLVPILAF